MDEWISCKDRLPPPLILVLASNPHVQSLSWIYGKDELGKPSWWHDTWEHADQFVTEWRYLDDEEVNDLRNLSERGWPKFKQFGCRLLKRDEIDE